MSQFGLQNLKDKVYEQMNEANDKITKADADRAVKAVLESIQQAVTDGEKVILQGFGTFEKTKRSARTGNNPQTGEKMEIAAHNTVHFKVSKAFKEAVN